MRSCIVNLSINVCLVDKNEKNMDIDKKNARDKILSMSYFNIKKVCIYYL